MAPVGESLSTPGIHQLPGGPLLDVPSSLLRVCSWYLTLWPVPIGEQCAKARTFIDGKRSYRQRKRKNNCVIVNGSVATSDGRRWVSIGTSHAREVLCKWVRGYRAQLLNAVASHYNWLEPCATLPVTLYGKSLKTDCYETRDGVSLFQMTNVHQINVKIFIIGRVGTLERRI